MTAIPAPVLELRNEELLAAEAISRTSGGLDADLITAQINTLIELRKRVTTMELAPPVCPELTNANPSAPHTVILETIAWLLAQMGYKINQIPDANLIAFANLFGIELIEATPAKTILHFVSNAPAFTPVTIPAGTHVKTSDGAIVFTTDHDLTIAANQTTGDTAATATTAGHLLLAPAQLTVMIDNVTYVISVTNQHAIDSGADAETVESALDRMRRYQQRGERIVTAKDLEDAILTEALGGNGVVKAFPFVADGNFHSHTAGYTTVIVMTSTGDTIDDLQRGAIAVLLAQVVGNQFVYVRDPYYTDFDVEVTVAIADGSPQATVLASIESRLRSFYAAARDHFGKLILRADIVAIIESTEGVERIVSDPAGPILTAPTLDRSLKPWQLPRLGEVTIHVA
jgi:hypothetical protein